MNWVLPGVVKTFFHLSEGGVKHFFLDTEGGSDIFLQLFYCFELLILVTSSFIYTLTLWKKLHTLCIFIIYNRNSKNNSRINH